LAAREGRSAGYAADLFARCSIALLICAAVLCLLIVPVRRMLENTRSDKPQEPAANA
jgi:POT family proton-dependent oligopeptide transporter